MKANRKLITLLSACFLVATLFLFLNFTFSRQRHDAYIGPRDGLPLSEIVNAYPGSPKTIKVEIAKGEVAYIDESVEVDELIINGELHCSSRTTNKTIEIKARVIYVNGLFQCGTSSNTYNSKLIISLKPGNLDPRKSVAYRGLIVNNGGKLVLSGSAGKAQMFRLSETVEPGQTFLKIDSLPVMERNRWKVGDEIVVAPTSYSHTEAESFRIIRTHGNIIFLDKKFLFRHWGQTERIRTRYNGLVNNDQRAEVANLTRNILIRPEEIENPISTTSAVGDELGGHVMVMKGGSAYVDSVEFFRMGQAGIIARYPFHWHILGDAPGQFIKNSSVHQSFQRCITIHRTNKVLVHNNVCYDFKGHGYFLEDGTETNNTLSNNLGIGAKYPYPAKTLLASDQSSGGNLDGRFPNVTIFWISHPKNIVINNRAAGSVGSGFWMAFENDIFDYLTNSTLHPINEPTLLFATNVSHSSQVGFTWDGAPTGGLTGNPNNPNDRAIDNAYYKPRTIPVFSGLVAYKNKQVGIYFRGYTAVFKNGITADNGWHYWLTYNEIIINSVMIGRSRNYSAKDQSQAMIGSRGRQQQVGIVQYDGPFELDGVDFVSYPQNKIYADGGPIDITPVPIGVVGGTERLTNSSKRVSFSPEPIHRVFMNSDDTSVKLTILGNSSLRDNDGTLTGVKGGGMIIGKTSLGILPESKCRDGGTKFHGHQVCPSTYKESQLHFFNGDGNSNPWSMPVALRRNDGAVSHEMSDWNYVFGNFGTPRRAGNKFALADSSSVSYEAMIKIKNPLVWLTAENLDINVPVTKVVGHGKNCSLSNVPAVPSLAALTSSKVSAYYSQKDELYFRLLPSQYFNYMVVPNYFGTAARYTSISSNIVCDGDPTPFVTGNIDAVTASRNGNDVKVSGWACDFTKDQNINVKLYIGGPAGSAESVLLQNTFASQTSETAVAFACGAPHSRGFRFTFIISSSIAESYIGKKVYVYGTPVSGAKDVAINQSGQFAIPSSFPRLPAANQSR